MLSLRLSPGLLAAGLCALCAATCHAKGPLSAYHESATTPNYRPEQYGQPNLFYNYYVPPAFGGMPTQLYLAPRPVPPVVGHTYFTYQPLMPHEFLYRHHRTYHRYYDNGRGLTRVKVRWW